MFVYLSNLTGKTQVAVRYVFNSCFEFIQSFESIKSLVVLVDLAI